MSIVKTTGRIQDMTPAALVAAVRAGADADIDRADADPDQRAALVAFFDGERDAPAGPAGEYRRAMFKLANRIHGGGEPAGYLMKWDGHTDTINGTAAVLAAHAAGDAEFMLTAHAREFAEYAAGWYGLTDPADVLELLLIQVRRANGGE